MVSSDSRNDVHSGPVTKVKNAFEVMMESAKNSRAFEIMSKHAYDSMIILKEPPKDFTIGIYGRGKLLSEVLNEIAEKDRGRIITLCINLIPDNLDYIDGLILIILLSKVGIINLYGDNVDIELKDEYE